MRGTARETARDPLLRRAMRSSGARGLLAAAGVGTNVLLVLVLFATYRTVEVNIRGYVGQPNADLWIAPRGTDNLIRSAALLSGELVPDVAALPGVRDAAPVLRSFVTVDARRGSPGRRGITLLAIGYRTPGGPGGPPALVAGREPRGPGEAILDRAAAHRLAVSLGDEITINGFAMRVVGLSARTNLVSAQFVFLDAAEAARLSGYGNSASFIPVTLAPGASPDAVAAGIRDLFPGVDVHLRRDFEERNVEEIFAGFRPFQLLVSAIGLVASTAVVALLVLATIEERRRDVAVLLALGAPLHAVATAVVWRTMRLVLGGVVAGSAAAALLAAALDRWAPTVQHALRSSDVARVLATFLVVALGAALVPLLRLGRADPVEAFRP